MKYIKSTALIIYMVVSLPIMVSAQSITRDEYLDVLINSHPLFEKEKLTAQIEMEEQKSYLGSQDWKVSSAVTYSHEDPMIAFSGPERMDTFSVSGGVEKRYWSTGGNLTASFSAGHTNLKINPVYGFPDAVFQNRVSITYTHPLLKNKKGFLDRLQYDLKEYDINISGIREREKLEDFLADSAVRFLDWVYLTEQQKIVAERLRLSEEELAVTKRKREANLIDQADVIRAEDAVRIWKQNLVLVESQWKGLQAELAVMSRHNELYNVEPQFDLYNTEEHSSLDREINHHVENSRLIMLLNVRLEQLEHSRTGHEETLKPDLSLVTQFNTKRMDDAGGKSLLMDHPDFLLGLQYKFPHKNRTAKARISKTDLQIKQLQKQIEDVTLALLSELNNLSIRINELEKVFALNREQIKSAQGRTEEEIKLYNQGRGELTFVIQSRDNEQ
ncbi:TolC family protein, partial [Candidatus Omnitrophota bacterium]